MKLSYKPYTLELRHVFTLATSSRNVTPIVLVSVESDGYIGYGEASLPPYNRHCYYFWKTFVDLIITSCKGRSFLSVFTTEIFSTISKPSTTSPKIVTEPSRCGTPPIVL